MLIFPCSFQWGMCFERHRFRKSQNRSRERARDQKEEQTTMNKYELALVVDAKIEEDARVATVEKAKDYVTKLAVLSQRVKSGARRNLLTRFST